MKCWFARERRCKNNSKIYFPFVMISFLEPEPNFNHLGNINEMVENVCFAVYTCFFCGECVLIFNVK